MFIFDSLLAAKRILFLGDPKINSVEEVQDYMMSAISLVSPPLSGILNLVHPYVHLQCDHLLDDHVYIGSATNPMFAQKKFKEKIDILINMSSDGSHNRKAVAFDNFDKVKGQEHYNYKDTAYFQYDEAFIDGLV